MRALFLNLVFFSLAFRAFGQIDNRVSMELFTRDVHPFLVKNCAECHSGAAMFLSGPPHSHNDPNVAFSSFIRRINFENPEKSVMMIMGKNRHFCEDYGSCKDVEVRSTEAAQKIMQYISSVKAASLPASASDAREIEAPQSAEPFRRTFQPMKPLRTQAFKVRADSEITEFNLQLRDGAQLRGLVKTIRDGVYQLSSLALVGSGYYVFQSATVLINGQPLPRLTGWERLDRAVALVGDLKGKSLPLALERPVLLMTVNDNLSFEIAHFDKVAQYPAFFCKSKPAPNHQSSLNKMIPFRTDWNEFSKGELSYGQLSSFCVRLESVIDFANPRRSPLLYNYIVDPADRASALNVIQNWIELPAN